MCLHAAFDFLFVGLNTGIVASIDLVVSGGNTIALNCNLALRMVQKLGKIDVDLSEPNLFRLRFPRLKLVLSISRHKLIRQSFSHHLSSVRQSCLMKLVPKAFRHTYRRTKESSLNRIKLQSVSLGTHTLRCFRQSNMETIS